LQLSKKSIVDSYLSGGIYHGVILCLIALLLWYLSITVNLHNIGDFAEAVIKAKRGKTTQIQLTSQGEFVIVSFSLARVIGVQLLCAVRLAIVCSLAWIGTLFIAYTETIVDLIINSLALEAVLNVDSLMFKALVPLDAATLASKLQPLPLRARHRLFGIDFRSLIVIVAVPAAIAITYSTVMTPRIERMAEARNILCRGNTNFLVSLDGLGIPHAVVHYGSPHVITSKYQADAVQQAIDGIGKEDPSSKLIWVPTQLELQSLQRTTLKQAVQVHQSTVCLDMLSQHLLSPTKHRNFRMMIDAHLPQKIYPPITNCSQVAHF